MVTLRQAKRLKECGFPQSEKGMFWVFFSEPDNSKQQWILCQRHIGCWWYVPKEEIMPFMFNDTTAREKVYCPTEKEMMEWLYENKNILGPISHWIHHKIDLTGALVEAIEITQRGKQR